MGNHKAALVEPRVPVSYAPGRPNPYRYYVLDMGYETPCWYWNGEQNNGGYAVFHLRQPRAVPVHRIYYEMTYGIPPKGFVLHHLCRNRACVNPDHLHLVTPAEHAALHRDDGSRPNPYFQVDNNG